MVSGFFVWQYYNEKVIEKNNNETKIKGQENNTPKINVYTMQGTITEIKKENGSSFLIVEAVDKDAFLFGKSFEVLVSSSTKISLQNNSVVMILNNGKLEPIGQNNGGDKNVIGTVSDLKVGDSVGVLSAVNILDKQSFVAVSVFKMTQ